MLKTNLKIALRNLRRNKSQALINIGGLALGMAVAIMIGLWTWDELSFNKNHKYYDNIARLIQHRNTGDNVSTWFSVMYPLAENLKDNYGTQFDRIVLSTFTRPQAMSFNNELHLPTGAFMEADAADLLSLKMEKGDRKNLEDTEAVFIRASLATQIFGTKDPMGEILNLEGKIPAQIAGVFEDLPENSSFSNIEFIANWELFIKLNPWVEQMNNPWGMSGFQTFVQIAPGKDFAAVESMVKDVVLDNVQQDQAAVAQKPVLALHPMQNWHLYSDFKDGKNVGGRIQYVWLFGIIGIFVLILACINFMNLSTARSEKRAKEVGIRKTIGSERGQLINQFFGESVLVAFLSLILALGIVEVSMPWFEEVSGKQFASFWNNPIFWISTLGFTVFTGLLAGSYPALYLSSFKPINAFRGTFLKGRQGATPRKILVVLQFAVSTILIIGTLMVYQQIEFAQDRTLGYDQKNLANIYVNSGDVAGNFEVVRNTLKSSGTIEEIALSNSPITMYWFTSGSLSWRGKSENAGVDFPNTGVSHEYGKTVGWQFVEGRDFDKERSSDSSAFVINQSAAQFIGFENPIGEILQWDDKSYQIIGVIEDMIVESPYAPIRPAFYHIAESPGIVLNVKLNSAMKASESIAQVESTLKAQIPNAIFEISFVDEMFNRKFNNEARIGKLTSLFSLLAILISCLGLFGLASYVAEQRTKEIGIRRVLGASISSVWTLLTKDFIKLVFIATLIAIPIAYYLIQNWLSDYEYHVEISWWIFPVVGLLLLGITILTVSFQSIKAAIAKPSASLSSE